MREQSAIDRINERIGDPEEIADLSGYSQETKTYKESLAQFDGKMSANARTAIEWVASVLNLKGVKAKDAPSAMAWNLYQHFNQNTSAQADFWRAIWPKVVPSKSELDKQEQFRDDGREVLKLIDEIERIAYAAGEHLPGS